VGDNIYSLLGWPLQRLPLQESTAPNREGVTIVSSPGPIYLHLVSRIFPEAAVLPASELFGEEECNANVNDNKLRMLPAGCKFELISLTFTLH